MGVAGLSVFLSRPESPVESGTMWANVQMSCDTEARRCVDNGSGNVAFQQRPDLTARVEGHTDSLGSAEVNQTLSQQRAEAVMQALAERGVDAARLSARGYGADRPIASNATDTGRSENRRVEIHVIQ